MVVMAAMPELTRMAARGAVSPFERCQAGLDGAYGRVTVACILLAQDLVAEHAFFHETDQVGGIGERVGGSLHDGRGEAVVRVITSGARVQSLRAESRRWPRCGGGRVHGGSGSER